MKSEKQKQWEQQVNNLFAILDPKSGHTQEESDEAVEKFFDEMDSQQKDAKSNKKDCRS